MPIKNQYQTKVVQAYTSDDVLYNGSPFIAQININNQWHEIYIAMECIQATIILLSISGECYFEKIIKMVIEAFIATNIDSLDCEIDNFKDSLYEVLIESNVESMIEDAIENVSNEFMGGECPRTAFH